MLIIILQLLTIFILYRSGFALNKFHTWYKYERELPLAYQKHKEWQKW